MKLVSGVMDNTDDRPSSLRHFWLIAAFLFVLFPIIALASSSKEDEERPHHNRDIIRQLDTIEGTLVDLSTQILDAENRLDNRLDLLEGDLFFLVGAAESQEKDITISSTLCFSAEAFRTYELGIHAEAGVGRPNVLDAKLVAEVDGKIIGVDIGLTEPICIDVPLHKIASTPLATFDNTEDFDELIAGIVAPSQAIIPVVATL